MAGLAETAKLIASLELQDKMSAGLRKASANVSGLEKNMGRLGTVGKGLAVGMAAVGTAVAVGIGASVKSGIDALVELESATAQTEAVIKSTGGAAKVTAADVRTLAESMEDLTTIDDKVVQSAANMLLTFTNVRNEAGKGNDIFNQSVAVLADMSTALGTDMSQSAIQLGKALNDPVAGITALKRVGVTFDASQMKLIKTLVKEGKVLEAQRVILAELNKEFGGSAAKQADTYAGKMRRLNDAVEGLQMGLAEALLPALSELSTELNTALRDERLMAAVKSFGKDLAAGFREGVKFAKQLPWDKIGQGLSIAAGAAKTLITAFTSLPPEAMAALLAIGGLNKLSGGAVVKITADLAGDALGALGKGLLQRGATPANPLFTKEVGLGGGAGGGLPKGAAPVAAVGGIGAAGLGTLAAMVAAPILMNLIIPELFKGRKGDSGPTLATNKNPAFATTAVMNSIAQSMTATAKNTAGTTDKVSDMSTVLKNGFAVEATTIRNGFVTQRATGEKTASRLQSLSAATSSGLARTAANALATANAIRAKNMSPKVNVNVGFTNIVSVRAVTNGQTTVRRYTGGVSTGYTIL